MRWAPRGLLTPISESMAPLGLIPRGVSGPANHDCGTSTYISRGAGFVAERSGSLDHIDLAVGYISGTTGVVVTLVTDEAGVPSIDNQILESWTVQQEDTCCFDKLKLKLRSAAHPIISNGSKYWVVVSPLGFDSLSRWQNSPKAQDHFATSFDGGHGWNLNEGPPPPAFDIWVL
jgi:hypothetical protein